MQSVISVRFIETRGQLISLSKDKVSVYVIAVCTSYWWIPDLCKYHWQGSVKKKVGVTDHLS